VVLTWDMSHFVKAGKYGVNPHSILVRFDCDLSLRVDDPDMKGTGIRHNLDVYYR